MELWQSIIFIFGGNAALLIMSGWLIRSLGAQFLTKDLEKFKGSLTAASNVTTERLKHELQIAAVEHQVTFSKLHERRATIIAEIYSLLVEAHWAFESFISEVEWAGEPSKQEKYKIGMEKATNFYQYFSKNRIYLSSSLSEQVETFFRGMRREVIGFSRYVSKDDQFLSDEIVEKKYSRWTNVVYYFDNDVPAAKAALEIEFRKIIGVL